MLTGGKVISDKNKAGERFRILNNIALIGQFGLSLIMPLLICTFLCYFLVSKGIAGGWVYIPGFILGLGASFMTAYKFYLYVQKKEGPSSAPKRRKGIYFNRHI